MIDTVLKIVALACFIVFVAFLPIYVPQYDLIGVTVLVAAMAAYDFLIYRADRRRRRS